MAEPSSVALATGALASRCNFAARCIETVWVVQPLVSKRNRAIMLLYRPPFLLVLVVLVGFLALLWAVSDHVLSWFEGRAPAMSQTALAGVDVVFAAALVSVTIMLYRLEAQRDRSGFQIRRARLSYGGGDPSGGMSLFFEVANRHGISSCLQEDDVVVKVGAKEFRAQLVELAEGPRRRVRLEEDALPLMVPVGHVRAFEALFDEKDNDELAILRGKEAVLWVSSVAPGSVLRTPS